MFPGQIGTQPYTQPRGQRRQPHLHAVCRLRKKRRRPNGQRLQLPHRERLLRRDTQRHVAGYSHRLACYHIGRRHAAGTPMRQLSAPFRHTPRHDSQSLCQSTKSTRGIYGPIKASRRSHSRDKPPQPPHCYRPRRPSLPYRPLGAAQDIGHDS